MNSKLQLFNFEGNQVRTLEINDEPYFVGKDAASILGYSNTRKAIQDHVDPEDKKDGVTIRDSIRRNQKPMVINAHVDEEDKLKYQISTAGQKCSPSMEPHQY